MILFKLIMNLVLCLGLLPGSRLQGKGREKLPPPSGTHVFTIVFEARAAASDGTSATSQIEVQFAPSALRMGASSPARPWCTWTRSLRNSTSWAPVPSP